MINFLSVLTVIGQVISLFLIWALLRGWLFKKQMPKINAFIQRYGLIFMLVVALTATGGSLYLSEILMWAPCKLCWFQRIFIYPQVPLLLVALWKKDKTIASYLLVLCMIGLLFSVRHYIEQIMATFFPPNVDPFTPCDTTGVSCATTYTFRFGYITIPMMAFTALLMNGLTSILLLRKGALSKK